MSLAAGSRLGPYEILAPLGAGGMGEVYRARDPRLGRELAIKVLPAETSADRERLARFEQEARAASSLNHPNIVTIHEIGRVDTVSYIAMELVLGRTLREILAEGPVPLRRLLSIGVQLADGLARAHEAGIVHRDLKPENVIVTRDGHVKILDFGLAKLVPHAESDSSQLATAVDPTRSGIVLGTVGYMSPEQASGQPLDFRSDQFSLGLILYEMACGRRAFSRATAAETLAAIIRDEPEPLRSAAPIAPAPLRWVVERCLAKDPQERYASTRDLARDVAQIREHVSEASGEVAPAATRRRRSWVAPAVAAGLTAAAALAAFALLRRAPPTTPARAVRFTVGIPPGTDYAPWEVSRGFSISPDGTRLVVEASAKGRRHLYVRPIDSEQFTELEGSTDAISHFWSPDGRFIAFFAEGKLKKIPAGGGQPQILCDAHFAFLGTWNAAGTILFSEVNPPGIYRVSDAGGAPELVLAPDSALKQLNLIWPHFLPDGRHFIYLANLAPGTGVRDLRVGSLGSKDTTSLGHADSRVEYVGPGYLIFVREGALFAQAFDARSTRLTGQPRQLASNVHYFFGPSFGDFSASRTEDIAYETASLASRFVWYSRDGTAGRQLGAGGIDRGLRISPDGSRVAVALHDPRVGSADIWVFETGSDVSTRLNSDPMDEGGPVWSPDASRLFYRSDRKGPPDIYEMAPAVPGSEKPFLEEPGLQQPEDVSADGRRLAYLEGVSSTDWNIWLHPLVGGGKPSAWLPSRFSQVEPRFSPDGRWIAFESDESETPEIYVALTEGGAQKRRLSPAGGRHPRWKRDGRELYYVDPSNSVMAVPVTPGVPWQSGPPAALFRVDGEIRTWDAAADGSRFLISVLDKNRESPLRVIVNWPGLLRGER